MGHTAIRLPGNKIAVCYQYPLLRGLQRHLRPRKKAGKQIAKPSASNGQCWYWCSLQEAK
jgi:hypothetical protein